MSKIKIYLDLDGVIAQFVNQSKKVHNRTDEATCWDYYKAWGITTTEFWKKIDADEFFWENIEKYSWTDELVDLVKSVDPKYTVLTSPHNHPNSYKGKCTWIKEVLKIDPPKRAILTAIKEDCAKPNRVLIDDSNDNCEKFIAAGGQAILFPQLWNNNDHLVSNRVGYVRAALNLITTLHTEFGGV